MSDYGNIRYAPADISWMTAPCSKMSIGGNSGGTLGSLASAVYISASRAILVPFRVARPTRIFKMFTLNGTAVGYEQH